MRKADFGPINGTIASAFEDGEVVRILRVQNYAVDSILLLVSHVFILPISRAREEYPESVHSENAEDPLQCSK